MGEWSGPRLSRGPRKTDPDELAADAAHGDQVPRCETCGVPKDLTRFGLTLAGRSVGRITLCGHCYYHGNPIDPQAGDPLRAT